MQEKPRFGIALAGVGGCLCIAAGIVVTAPRESAVPSVNGLPAARAERLPRLPMPSWSEVAVTRPTAGAGPVRATLGSRQAVPVAASASAEVHPQARYRRALDTGKRQSAIGNRQSPAPLMLGNAPQASGADIVIGDNGAREHGPVTGALVTAGTHIGGGFRTVGRTLKRVF